VQAFGAVFACAGLSILAGSALNRVLVTRYEQMTLIGFGVTIMGLAGLQLLVMAWFNEAPFWWLWACVCAFMFTIALVMANATVLALDPLPRIAGVASSIIGTLQNLAGAAGALVGAAIYNSSVRNAVALMGAVALIVAVVFLLRPWIVPGPLVHHPDELARP
jgi:DHA1 family bicyclomycin/chloramphenicol resistance-like MFS transporter